MDKLTKDKVAKMKEVSGETRGVVFDTDINFIKRNGGEDGFKKIKARLEELGESLEYEKIQTMEFYPLWKRMLSLAVIKDVLELDDQEIERMGKEAPKISLLIRMFARFFFSIEETIKQAAEMWSKHYTIGSIEAGVIKEGETSIILKDISVPEIFLVYLGGYLKTIVEMIVNEKVSVSRRPLGDNIHEYRCTWKES